MAAAVRILAEVRELGSELFEAVLRQAESLAVALDAHIRTGPPIGFEQRHLTVHL